MNSRNRIITIFFVIILLLSITTSSFAEGNFAFLKTVKNCHDHIRKNDYYYSKGVELPLDRDGNRRVDCSSFLSWSLYIYTDGKFDASKDSNWFLNVAKDLKAGRTPDNPEITSNWKVINNPDNFEPGDIMCYKKHVQIYAGQNNNGDHLVYSAGTDTSIGEKISIISDGYFYSTLYAIRIP